MIERFPGDQLPKTALASQLRAAMRCYPTGVTVVTTILDGRPHGFTANAFTSVSLEPPSILVCVNQRARSHALIARTRCFCVNILRFEQQALAIRFAISGDDAQFVGLTWRSIEGGAPHIIGSLASLDCSLTEAHAVTTHSIFVGNVLNTLLSDGCPLGYHAGAFTNFGRT